MLTCVPGSGQARWAGGRRCEEDSRAGLVCRAPAHRSGRSPLRHGVSRSHRSSEGGQCWPLFQLRKQAQPHEGQSPRASHWRQPGQAPRFAHSKVPVLRMSLPDLQGWPQGRGGDLLWPAGPPQPCREGLCRHVITQRDQSWRGLRTHRRSSRVCHRAGTSPRGLPMTQRCPQQEDAQPIRGQLWWPENVAQPPP